MSTHIKFPADTKAAAKEAGNSLVAFGYDGPAARYSAFDHLPHETATKLFLFVNYVLAKRPDADFIPAVPKQSEKKAKAANIKSRP